MSPAAGGSPRHDSRFTMPVWLGACLFLAMALFLLWEDHRAHILGALPYLLLLACSFVHLFMHRGHGHVPALLENDESSWTARRKEAS